MAATPTIVELRHQLQYLLPVIFEQYQVESIVLFGSCVRAEQHPDSDLDVLVTFRETPDLFTFIRLEQFLGDAIGIPVDLVMKDALKPYIGERILREATPV